MTSRRTAARCTCAAIADVPRWRQPALHGRGRRLPRDQGDPDRRRRRLGLPHRRRRRPSAVRVARDEDRRRRHRDPATIVGEIPDLPGVHGIALAPDLGRGFTSNGRANSSTIVDLKTLKPIGTVPTGANPDSIRYLAVPQGSLDVQPHRRFGHRVRCPRPARSSRRSTSAASSKRPSRIRRRESGVRQRRGQGRHRGRGHQQAHAGRHLADRRMRRPDGARVRRSESPAPERVRRQDGGDRQHVGQGGHELSDRARRGRQRLRSGDAASVCLERHGGC